MSIFLLAAMGAMSCPVGCGVYAAVRHLLDRRALTLAFTRGRERRLSPNPWRQ